MPGGPFDFLHIKRRTAGSSNELSFDVLDAKRGELDVKPQRAQQQQHIAAAHKPSQGSYQGVAGTSTLSAADEVVRRKRARRSRAIRLGVIVAFAIAALVGTGAYFGYTYYQGKLDFSGKFHQLIDRFVEIDQTMVTVDALMADPLDPAGQDERSEASERFVSINRELNAVVAAAHEMEGSAQTDRDRVALEEVCEAATARQNMLEEAENAFALSKQANLLYDSASKAWRDVLKADSLAREATKLANDAGTEQATKDARDKTKQARDLMASAKMALEQVEKEKGDVDFSDEKAYIEKRVEALDAAIETSDALLEIDRAAARSANEAYNAADEEAAALAGELLDSPSRKALNAFNNELERVLEAYAQSRNATTAADSAIRAYI